MLSKVATRRVALTRLPAALTQVSKRFLQTEYKPGTPISFVDIMNGTYEDPQYVL
jgi:hypothetical protein